MDLLLKSHKVVVTGSTSGIGLAIAKAFLDEGARVVINGRDRAKTEKVKTQLQKKYGQDNILCYTGDMSDQKAVIECASYVKNSWGKIHVLIPNLGSGKPLGGDRLDMEEWSVLYDVNLFSAVRLLKAFEDMWEAGEEDKAVILLSSLAAEDRIGAPYAYAAAKSSIRTLSKYLSTDYAQRGIRVNCVLPGNVYFQGGRWEELHRQDRDGVDAYIHSCVPMKRFGAPNEIADAVVFLASGRAGFISGSTLKIDGGQSLCI